jgi:hypothetical protein
MTELMLCNSVESSGSLLCRMLKHP